jgi:uncharacterized glyoxalase superfamily protein PhnB
VLALDVPDAEAVFTRAVAAGATVRQPLQEVFWGRPAWTARRSFRAPLEREPTSARRAPR